MKLKTLYKTDLKSSLLDSIPLFAMWLFFGILGMILWNTGWFAKVLILGVLGISVFFWIVLFFGYYVLIEEKGVRVYRFFRCTDTYSKSDIVTVKYKKRLTDSSYKMSAMNATTKEKLCIYDAGGNFLFYVSDDEIARNYFRNELKLVIDVSSAVLGEE